MPKPVTPFDVDEIVKAQLEGMRAPDSSRAEVAAFAKRDKLVRGLDADGRGALTVVAAALINTMQRCGAARGRRRKAA